MHLKDTSNSYGWISILFHWLTAGCVLVLWFIADSASILETRQQQSEQIGLHISIAASAYLFLCIRIGWRMKQGHPKIDNQGPIDHFIAKSAHYLLLLAMVLLLLTGPVMVWSGGGEIKVFDWFTIPSPFGLMPILHDLSERVHGFSGLAIILITAVHAAGALKHLMFDDDDVFLRILIPK